MSVSDRIAGSARKALALLPRGRVLRILGLALPVLVLLYYLVGMLLTHVIDDDLEFQPPPAYVVEGGSRAVAMAAALIHREVDEHRWVANDPWFLPAAPLDNMPNFQQGIISALGRFAFELTDQIGRARGSSRTDPDLQEAAGQLQYPGNIWIFDLSTSWAPTTPSESRYRKAERSLRAYNNRLAQKQAVLELRSDNLLATLDRIALDLGASSAVIENHLENHAGGFIDMRADDLFYGIKGQVYAYYLVLRELGADFEEVIAERQLGGVWQGMLESMRDAAALSPWIVVNGAPDSQLQPSHLAAQGFFVLRAHTKLREVTNILLK